MAYPNLTQELLRSIHYPEPIYPSVADEHFRQAIRSILALYERGVIDSEHRDRLIKEIITAIVSRRVEQMVDDMTHAILSVSNEPRLTQASSGYPLGMIGPVPTPASMPPPVLHPQVHQGGWRE